MQTVFLEVNRPSISLDHQAAACCQCRSQRQKPKRARLWPMPLFFLANDDIWRGAPPTMGCSRGSAEGIVHTHASTVTDSAVGDLEIEGRGSGTADVHVRELGRCILVTPCPGHAVGVRQRDIKPGRSSSWLAAGGKNPSATIAAKPLSLSLSLIALWLYPFINSPCDPTSSSFIFSTTARRH